MKKTAISTTVAVFFMAAIFYFYTHKPLSRIPSERQNISAVNFFALGDQGSGAISQWQVAHAMEKVAEKNNNLDFVTFLGDNFYGKGIETITDTKWMSRFEEVYQGKYLGSVPFYAVLGNHDHMLNPAAQIEYSKKNMGSNRWRMPNWYYSADFGDANGHPIIRMVFIDTCLKREELVKEAEYIKEQFSDQHTAPVWKIVVGHFPIRNYGKHGEITDMLSIILPALQQAHVDLYLSGHDHNQQVIARDGEPLYFVSGGGGAELYPVKQGASDLLFSRSAHGFIAVSANPEILTIQHLDVSGQLEAQYKVDRKCSLPLRQCLNPG